MSSVKLSGKWKHIGSAVYESTNGDRIHLNGLIRFANKEHLTPLIEQFNGVVRLVGGSRKRALMYIAESGGKS